jgi:beta-phosphoglucomutase-like phosphatase (HAD superfamily)
VRAFPSTAALLHRLQDAGLPIALITVSRNSAAVLTAAGVRDLFDVVVDGK